jgi:hypothetical protein
MNGQCEWTTVPIAVDPTNPGTVDPTKPVTQEGRCQLVAGSSSAAATVDVCPPNKDKSACYQMNGQCEWTTTPITVDPTNPGTVDPTKPTTPSTPAGETPLFTKEFCHPVKVDKATAEGDFAACLQKSATECTGNCVWSNGKALIPDHDFCAPAFMTDDV